MAYGSLTLRKNLYFWYNQSMEFISDFVEQWLQVSDYF